MNESVIVPVMVKLGDLANSRRFGQPLSAVIEPAIRLARAANPGKPLGMAIMNAAADAESVPSFSPEFIQSCHEVFRSLLEAPAAPVVDANNLPMAPENWPKQPVTEWASALNVVVGPVETTPSPGQ